MGNGEDKSPLASWNFWSTPSSQVLAERRRGLWPLKVGHRALKGREGGLKALVGRYRLRMHKCKTLAP